MLRHHGWQDLLWKCRGLVWIFDNGLWRELGGSLNQKSEIVALGLVLVLPFELQKVTNELLHSMASSLCREGDFAARVD